MPPYGDNRAVMPRRRGCGPRLTLALVLALFAIVSYYMGTREEVNPITGETQRLSMSVDQEIALGMHAAPDMAQQFGGLHRDPRERQIVDTVGARVVQKSSAGQTEYQFAFHLLADPETVNAFALPGGQIFLTYGLYKLLGTEDELAGVLSHEVGHVVGRHSSEQIAKSKLLDGLTGAAVVAATDPNSGDGRAAAQVAMVVNQLINTKYGRGDELESDDLGVRFLYESGYDPQALIGVMEILDKAASGSRQPEFLSTHPNPGNRIEHIKAAIGKYREMERQ